MVEGEQDQKEVRAASGKKKSEKFYKYLAHTSYLLS